MKALFHFSKRTPVNMSGLKKRGEEIFPRNNNAVKLLGVVRGAVWSI
jgi:hypothetical protein